MLQTGWYSFVIVDTGGYTLLSSVRVILPPKQHRRHGCRDTFFPLLLAFSLILRWQQSHFFVKPLLCRAPADRNIVSNVYSPILGAHYYGEMLYL